MEIHVHIHDGSVKEGRKPRSSSKKTPSSKGSKPKSKAKRAPMTRKTQLAINRGRKTAGLKPIKWKKKGA